MRVPDLRQQRVGRAEVLDRVEFAGRVEAVGADVDVATAVVNEPWANGYSG
jgi:hypothetical protein